MAAATGSYRHGFAPRDGAPRYPSLWRGVIGAWCPLLGPSGLVVRDWSPYRNHGTLTSIGANDAWKQDSGYYVDFTAGASFAYCDMGDQAILDVGTGDITLSWWMKWTHGSGYNVYLGKSANTFGTGAGWNVANAGLGDGRYMFRIADGTTEFQLRNTTAMNDGQWHHACACIDRSGTTLSFLYQDGLDDSSRSGGMPGGDTGNAEAFQFTRSGTNADVSFDDVRVFNRTLTFNEIRLLSRRRGIAYELGDRIVGAAEGVAPFPIHYRMMISVP